MRLTVVLIWPEQPFPIFAMSVPNCILGFVLKSFFLLLFLHICQTMRHLQASSGSQLELCCCFTCDLSYTLPKSLGVCFIYSSAYLTCKTCAALWSSCATASFWLVLFGYCTTPAAPWDPRSETFSSLSDMLKTC